MTAPAAIRSRCIVTPQGVVDGTVTIEEGLIGSVTTSRVPGALDVGEAMLLPGFVDPHVHLNEPGRTDWEGFETGTRAAAAAGITTLVDMPLNSLPVTTTRTAFEAKRAAAEGKLRVDTGFHAGVVPGNLQELPGLVAAGVCGAKAFLVDSGIPEFPPVGETELRPAMRLLAGAGVPLLAHAEIAGPAPEPGDDAASHAASRPPDWEVRAVDLLIRLCRETGCRTHVVHVAAQECLPLLRRAKAEGLPLTAETCPHYLYFALERMSPDNALFKCAPPIRGSGNAAALLDALKDGTLDLVASDHSPSPPEMKQGGFRSAWGGISSLALGPSVLWTLHPDAVDLARWMSAAPARLAGLVDRGAIAPGKRADLVVFDGGGSRTVTEDVLHTRHRISPYLGCTLRGVTRMTFLAGRCVYHDGAFPGKPIARVLHAPN